MQKQRPLPGILVTGALLASVLYLLTSIHKRNPWELLQFPSKASRDSAPGLPFSVLAELTCPDTAGPGKQSTGLPWAAGHGIPSGGNGRKEDSQDLHTEVFRTHTLSSPKAPLPRLDKVSL